MVDNFRGIDFITKRRDEHLLRMRKNLENGVWPVELRHRSKGNNLRGSVASEDNRKLILDFEKEWGYLGKTVMTRMDYVTKLYNFAEWLGQRSFKDVAKEDLISYFDKLKVEGSHGRKGINDRTLNNVKVVIKVFHKWLNGGETHPDCVKWIKAKIHRNDITAEMILTGEEIRKLVESAGSFRNKAIVAILYESACRISEFLGMKIKDVKFDEMGAKVRVSGKTGEREIRLVNSVPYLKEWLKIHPFKSEPDAYVWVSIPGTKGRPVEKIGMPLGETGINGLLKRLGEKSGVTKKIYPHLFRHTRITELAAKLSGTVLNNYVGWKTNSSMAEVYVHHSRNEIDKAVLRNIYNVTHFEKSQEVVERLLSQVCHNCGEKNMAEVDYCTKCNMPLKIGEFKNKVEQNEWFAKKIEASPEIFQAFLKSEIQKAVEELFKLRVSR